MPGVVTPPRNPPRTRPRTGTGREGQVIPREILEPTRNPTQYQVPSPTQGVSGLPFYDNVPLDDPMYEGQPIPNGQIIRVGKVNGQCVITIPATTGRKRLGQQVLIARIAQTIAVNAYRQGFNHGYGSAQNPINVKQHCLRITGFVRYLDGQMKRAILSQEPSFPRKKSITGVTRQGRKRKGPG